MKKYLLLLLLCIQQSKSNQLETLMVALLASLFCAATCPIGTLLTTRTSSIPDPCQIKPLLDYLIPQDESFINVTTFHVWQNHVSTWKLTKTSGISYYVRAAPIGEKPYVSFVDMVEIMQHVGSKSSFMHDCLTLTQPDYSSIPVQRPLSLPSELSSDYIVTEDMKGAYMPQHWVKWTIAQRKTFLRDFADMFVELARCNLPPPIQRKHELLGPRTARDILAEDITARFGVHEPELERNLLAILDGLITLHPDPTSTSLDRISLDQNDFNYVSFAIVL